jgi:hypothetical protein
LVLLAPLVAGDLPCFAGLRLACASKHYQCSRNDQGPHLSPPPGNDFYIGTKISVPEASASLNVHHTTVTAARKVLQNPATDNAIVMRPPEKKAA